MPTTLNEQLLAKGGVLLGSAGSPAVATPDELARRKHLVTHQHAASRTAFGGQINPRRYPGLDFWLHAGRISEGLQVYDNFARANAEALGNATSGQTWLQHAGNVGILNNEAYCVGEGEGIAVVSIPTGIHDGVVSFFSKWVTGGLVWISGQQSGNSKVNVTFTQSTGKVRIERFKEGVLTNRIEAAIRPPLEVGKTYLFSAAFVGNKYIAYKPTQGSFEFQVQAEASDAESWCVNNQECGFGLNSTGRITNFEVSTVTPANGGALSCWPDLARPDLTQNATQTTAANKPTCLSQGLNGKPGVSFNGTTGEIRSGAQSKRTTFTWTFVVNPTELAGQVVLVGGTANGDLSLEVTASGQLKIVSQNIETLVTNELEKLAVNQPVIISLTMDTNGDFVWYVNGRPSQCGTLSHTFEEGTLVIGYHGGGVHFKGVMGQGIRHNRVLRGSEIRDLTQELAAEYGITIQPRIGRITSIPVNIAGPIKGVNIEPASTNYGFHEEGGFGGLWGEWPLAYLEECIAKAKAIAGVTVVRIIGQPSIVYKGWTAEATYLERLAQLAGLLDAKGLYLHYTVGDTRHLKNEPAATYQAFLGKCAETLVGHNVFAVELTNEIIGSYTVFPEPILWQWMGQWAAEVRAKLPGVPLTISNVGSGVGFSNGPIGRMVDYVRNARFDDIVDFHCEHLYEPASGNGLTEHTLDPLLVFSDKPILIGECGMEATETTEKIENYWRHIKALLESDRRIMGALAWSIVGEKFGLYNPVTHANNAATYAGFGTLPSGVYA